ncbi:MAG: HEPN domain-containing protein [archaeon]|nr:HEPN domain-containing protein [archaeon]
MAKESRYWKDWLDKADKDLERVEKRLANGDTEDATFHLQQAIEKYLKGYLLSKGWKFKPVHDLERLLDEVVQFDTNFEQFRDICQRINPYYIEERYPFFFPQPDKEEVKKSLIAAKELVKRIQKEMK